MTFEERWSERGIEPSRPAQPAFDPNKWLKDTAPAAPPAAFDPKAWLEQTAPESGARQIARGALRGATGEAIGAADLVRKYFGPARLLEQAARAIPGVDPLVHQAGTAARRWINQPDRSGLETAGRYGGMVAPYVLQPELGLEGLATRALPWAASKVLPAGTKVLGLGARGTRLVKGGARVGEAAFKGGEAGAIQDPEHPLEGAERGAATSAAFPIGGKALRVAAPLAGKVAKVAGSAGLADLASKFMGPAGYFLYPAAARSSVGRGLEAAGRWVFDRAGRVVGWRPFSSAAGVPAGQPSEQEPVSRQEGGPLASGQPAVVGEQGPELFVPDQPGVVVPADEEPGVTPKPGQRVPYATPAAAQAADAARRNLARMIPGSSVVEYLTTPAPKPQEPPPGFVGKVPPRDPSNPLAAEAVADVASSLVPEAKIGLGLKAAMAAGGIAPKIGRKAARSLAPTLGELAETAPFPQYAERYPEAVRGVPTFDTKTGKFYMAKQLSPEAERFQRVRNEIDKALTEKGYTPYFNPAERFHADPSKYPAMLDTAQQLPSKMETLEKWTRAFDTPETRARLQQMYKVGQTIPNAENWYMMGQLERAYIKEFGPELGRENFRNNFAAAMAATTGGADPTANFLMAHYANFLRGRGEDFPRVTAAENRQMQRFAKSEGKAYVDKEGKPINKTGDIAAYKLPFPIGGQYAAKNLEQYERLFGEAATGKDIAEALVETNPKRLDFTQSFLGHPHSFTWDIQMTKGAIGKDMPPVGTYGIMERIGREEAMKAGVPAQHFQDVAWAGQKRMLDEAKGALSDYAGPMIEHVNRSIERTHRLTGMAREEIVRRGLLRGEIPLYGLGALAAGAAAQQDRQ
jgi:hypothetical protein